jgi:heme oxygenase (mycobilin-producing)
MTLLRYYRLTAAEGRGNDLSVALQTLAAKLAAIPQSISTEIFVDPDAPGTFVFIERWRSHDEQKTAAAILGKSAFTAISSVLAGPPESRNLIPLEQTTNSRP